MYKGFQSKNATLLIGANTVSFFGDTVFLVALNWWVIQVTGSAELLGVITAIGLLPSIVLNLVGGVAADRLNKKKILVATDFLSALLCTLLAFMMNENEVNVPLVITINILLTACYSLFSPTVRSIMPEVVSGGNIKQANSLLNMSNELVKITGPMVGSFLLSLSLVGVQGVFLINAFSFLLSGVMTLFLSYTKVSRQSSVWEDFKGGFRAFKEDMTLLRLLLVISLVNFFIAGFNIILPFYVKSEFNDSSLYGAALSAEAIGGVIGSILLGVSKRKETRLGQISRELLFCGASFLILLISQHQVAFIVCIALFGFFLTRFNVQFFTFIQTNVAEFLLGRVFSFIFTVAIALMPLGNLFFGYLSSHFLEYMLPVIGCGIMTSMLFFIFPAVRDK